jgi:hypothetical protein
LDTRLTALLCRKIVVVETKEVKTEWSNSRHTAVIDKPGGLSYGRLWLEKGCFANDDNKIYIIVF